MSICTQQTSIFYLRTLALFDFVFLSASKRRGNKLIEAIGETIKLYFVGFVLVIGVPSLPELLKEVQKAPFSSKNKS